MERNESIAAVPVDIRDPDTLKRFLDRLVERLDIVLGYRGSNSYVSTADVDELTKNIAETVESLLSDLSGLQLRIDELAAELAAQLEQLEAILARLDELDGKVALLTTYSDTNIRDFNSTEWLTAPVYTKFTALGSEIINPPVSVSVDDIAVEDTYGIVTDIEETSININPVATYTCYVEVRAAYVQKVIIIGNNFALSKLRAGLTWPELIANAWV